MNDVLAAIESHYDRHGVPPTYDWLAQQTGFSRTTIRRHISALRRAGIVTSLPGVKRCLVLNTRHEHAVRRFREAIRSGKSAGETQQIVVAIVQEVT